GAFRRANTSVPPLGHVFGLPSRPPLVERKRLLTPLPVQERTPSILERRRRQHALDKQEVRVPVAAHVRPKFSPARTGSTSRIGSPSRRVQATNSIGQRLPRTVSARRSWRPTARFRVSS